MRKQNFRFLSLSAIAAIGLIFMSCEKDEQSEPQVGLKFNTVKAPITLNAGLKSVDQPKELYFHSGQITIREIEFEVEIGDDSVEVNFNLESITQIDFATGQTTPDISYVQIPAGTYSSMEVEIELQDEGDTPSVVLYGTFVDIEGISHDIRFEFNSGETFEVEKEGTVEFKVNQSALAQVTIDPTAWFAEVTATQLSEAVKDSQGVIVISSTQNSEIFDIVADGLDLATEVEIEN